MVRHKTIKPRFILIASALIFATFCSVAPAAGQYTTASLAGTVVDPSGAAVPDAKVTVRNSASGLSETIPTGTDGTFLFPRLPVGVYRLSVEKAGFSTYNQEGIELSVNQAANVGVSLRVGRVAEEITVTSNAELVTTRSATVGQLVDARRVLDLPLDGRTPQSLVFLAVGTVDLTDKYCGLGCHGGVYPGEQQAGVNGAGPGNVNYQLDGAGHNDTYLNTNLPFPNPDSIQEFNLQSDNLTAEYGNAASGTVNIVTKSGTNDFHGTAFEFLRNGSLNARNFFAPKQDTLKRNQFGGSIGGPIRKDKLFFFGTYQGTRVRQAPEGKIAFVPTADERTGDFSDRLTNTLVSPCAAPGNPATPTDPAFDTGAIFDPSSARPFTCGNGEQITLEDQFGYQGQPNVMPPTRLSPAAQFFLQYIPLPNPLADEPARELHYTGARVSKTENQWMTKLDYIHGKHQISGRYFFTDFKQPPLIQKQNLLAATGEGNAVRVQNLAINHSYAVSPTFLFNTWFGWNQQRGGSLTSAPFSYPDAGVQIASQNPPELVLSVGGGFDIGTNHKGDFDRGDWTLRENVTVQRGGHELHFGGEAVRVKNHLINGFLMSGESYFFNQLSGDNTADFILGQTSQFDQGGGEFKLLRGTKWGFYTQDNWRVSQRLTLNLGVRWDPYFPYLERKGRVACFVPGAQSKRYPNAPAGLIYGGDNADPGCPKAGSESNIGNIAPRIGFAYRLTQNGKTSLRGGIGYYYTPPQTSAFNNFVDVAPFGPQFYFYDVSFEDPYGTVRLPDGSVGVPNPFPEQYGPRVPGPDATFILPTALYGTFQKDFRVPLLTTWNLTIEHQFGSDWVLRAAYVGNKGTFLYNDQKALRESNPAVYIPGASTDANTQERRLYPNFSTVGLLSSVNNSHYNGFQLNAERRFSKGLSILANYSWSKAQDDFGWTDPFDRKFDHGISDDDISHIFKFSNIWELPKTRYAGIAGGFLNGWTFNSILTWRGGFPFSVMCGCDNSFSAVFRDRARFIGTDLHAAQLGSGRSHNEMINEWFNTFLFDDLSQPGTFGNSGKNILRGPRFFNTDFGAIKNTRINEQFSIQLRAEFFNIFNKVNFKDPDNYLSDGPDVFGHIFSARDPRILQFALKLSF